jgi:hypothetical protein
MRPRPAALTTAILMAAVGTLEGAEVPCDFVISAAPYTASQQGHYCLANNITYNVPTGAAITIAANSVVLDLRGYKIGGQGAGPGTQARGVKAENRNTVTVRNGLIRGFHSGVDLSGLANTVEDLHVDAATAFGILALGDRAVVRRCVVTGTGSPTATTRPIAIYAGAAHAYVRDNVVTGLNGGPAQAAWGIIAIGGQLIDNHVVCGPDAGASVGLSAAFGLLRDNTALECTSPFLDGTKIGATIFP